MAPRKNNRVEEENELIEAEEEEDDDDLGPMEMPPSLLRKIVVLQKLNSDTEDIDVEYKKVDFADCVNYFQVLESRMRILYFALALFVS